MFQAIYDSPLHIPAAAWVGCAGAVGFALAKRRLVGFTMFFAVVCALDAWLTGPLTPLADGTAASTAAGVTFVIAGDFRFLLLALAGARFSFARAAAALALAFAVPLIAQVARAVGVPDGRPIFLVYEIAFAVLAIALRFILPRVIAPARKRFVLRLTHFEIAQYGLWTAADVLLLATGADVGYLVRLVPNLMYYTFFLPAAVAWAEDDA